MYGHAARFTELRRILTVLVVAAVLGGLTLIVLGILRYAATEGQSIWLIIAGGAIVFSFIAVAALCFMVLKIDANTVRTIDALHDVYDELTRQGAKLDDQVENARLSDAARSLVHREEERNTLRSAIQAEIKEHNWEAAWHFINEMERRFGFKEEAQRLRERLHHEQADSYKVEVEKAIPAVEALFDARDWKRAESEIGRLLKAFPQEARFARLRDEMNHRKLARKQELVRSFTEAVQRDDIDIDAGMNILRELDQYLTGQEAKQLEESARKVVKGKLLQLGVRFRFAVSEERWQDALEVGVNITEEFPNSRIAAEVRDMLKLLRQRAGLPTDVEVTGAAATEPPA